MRLVYTEDLRDERIFFHHLSEDAQAKALALKNISEPREVHWDILPIAHYYESIVCLSQDEIDMEALVTLGYYRES